MSMEFAANFIRLKLFLYSIIDKFMLIHSKENSAYFDIKTSNRNIKTCLHSKK